MTNAREIGAIVLRISPLLADHPPEVQGAALADLLAIWLAGHYVEGDEDATRKARAELLAFHCAQVRKLVAVIDARPRSRRDDLAPQGSPPAAAAGEPLAPE